MLHEPYDTASMATHRLLPEECQWAADRGDELSVERVLIFSYITLHQSETSTALSSRNQYEFSDL
jgi:hypothetical protein